MKELSNKARTLVLGFLSSGSARKLEELLEGFALSLALGADCRRIVRENPWLVADRDLVEHLANRLQVMDFALAAVAGQLVMEMEALIDTVGPRRRIVLSIRGNRMVMVDVIAGPEVVPHEYA
jgi:hypothetical protein